MEWGTPDGPTKLTVQARTAKAEQDTRQANTVHLGKTTLTGRACIHLHCRSVSSRLGLLLWPAQHLPHPAPLLNREG
jgi:hypothetical protein